MSKQQKSDLIALIAELIDKYHNESDYLQQIVGQLNERGSRTVTGREWNIQNLWSFIRQNRTELEHHRADLWSGEVVITVGRKKIHPLHAPELKRILAVGQWIDQISELLADEAIRAEDIMIPIILKKDLFDRWRSLHESLTETKPVMSDLNAVIDQALREYLDREDREVGL